MHKTFVVFLLLVIATISWIVDGTSVIVRKDVNHGLNTSDYWTADHPYMYTFKYTRLANGSVTLSKNASASMDWQEYKANVTASLPWYVSKYFTRETLAAKKDIRRYMYYNWVTPMDYGRSERGQRARSIEKTALKYFFGENLVIPMLKQAGLAIWNTIKNKYGGYIEKQLELQRLKSMSAAEICAVYNITPPSMANLTGYSNYTQPYKWHGYMMYFNGFGNHFLPYSNYQKRYYATIEDLPPPSLPAEQYPWLWSARLAMVREIMLHIMEFHAQNEQKLEEVVAGDSVNETIGGNDTSIANQAGDTRSLQQTDMFLAMTSDASFFGGNVEADGENQSTSSLSSWLSSSSSFEITDNAHSLDKEPTNVTDEIDIVEIRAMEEVEMRIQEFHFATGIARFERRTNNTYSLFPTFKEFENAKDSKTSSSSSDMDVGSSGSVDDINGSDSQSQDFFATRLGVYQSLLQFYAYPSIDRSFVVQYNGNDSSPPPDGQCTLDNQCMVQSGVTVYTPSLERLRFFSTAMNDSTITIEQQKQKRQKALLEMVHDAFDAEERALHHGLQAPSTVWYSKHDRDTDEFADALLGFVNSSLRSETSSSRYDDEVNPLHIFRSLKDGPNELFDETITYYDDTLENTKFAMEKAKSVPALEPFSEDELVELITSIAERMDTLSDTISNYTQIRAADIQYQELVNATLHQQEYDGSKYSLLGYGYFMPATNDMNVVYRDHKLPEPFHLVLRLLIRFQESHQLLRDESRYLLTCLALIRNEISYYRCRPN